MRRKACHRNKSAHCLEGQHVTLYIIKDLSKLGCLTHFHAIFDIKEKAKSLFVSNDLINATEV